MNMVSILTIAHVGRTSEKAIGTAPSAPTTGMVSRIMATILTTFRGAAALAMVALIGLTSACGYKTSSSSFIDNGTGTTASPTVTSISVEPFNSSLPRGLTQQFTATALYSDGTKADVSGTVTWSSSATTTATINGTGLLTAANLGTTTVTATLGTVSGSTPLTVTAATLVSIDITPVNRSIASGSQQQLLATGIYTDFTTQNLTTVVTWESSKPLVATISNEVPTQGVATGVSAGSTTITASLGAATGSTLLTVTGATLKSITVTPADASVPLGLTKQFMATGNYSDNTQQNITNFVTWTSSGPAATISMQGLASTATMGTTTVTASFGGVMGSATLTVTAATLVSITVTPAAPSIAKGTSIPFTATGTFSDQSQQNLTATAAWVSSAKNIASITNAPAAAGIASGLLQGTTVITAMSQGITSAPVTLTVTPATLVSITVTPVNPSTFVGHTVAFTATGTFTDMTTQPYTNIVTWTSVPQTVAAISNAAGTKGSATALAVGTAVITATDPTTLIAGSTRLNVTSAHAYATNFYDNTVSQYNIGADGTLTPLVVQGVSTVATGQFPFSIAVTPANTFAYVANYNRSNAANANTISQYSISAIDGSLSPLITATVPTGMVATGNNPNSVTVDPSGTHLYAANLDFNVNTPSTISQYTIAADGSLAPIQGQFPPAGPQPASLAINPAGTFAYVANFNGGLTGSVSQYTIDNMGALVPMNPATVFAGMGPNYIIVDPTGHYVYVANLYSNDISEYTIDQMTGALGTTVIQTTVASPNGPSFIAIGITGANTYAYVANSASDQVTQYTILNGVLSNPQTVSTGAGSQPYGLTIDATGKYLYVANRRAGTVSQFSINANTGSLTALPMPPAANTIAAGTQPTSITTTH